MSATAELEIRVSSGTAGALRRFEISLMDSPVARLKQGESVVLEVPAGDHELRARIDWHEGSTHLHLQEGHRTRVDVEYSYLITDGFFRPAQPFGFTIGRPRAT